MPSGTIATLPLEPPLVVKSNGWPVILNCALVAWKVVVATPPIASVPLELRARIVFVFVVCPASVVGGMPCNTSALVA